MGVLDGTCRRRGPFTWSGAPAYPMIDHPMQPDRNLAACLREAPWRDTVARCRKAKLFLSSVQHGRGSVEALGLLFQEDGRKWLKCVTKTGTGDVVEAQDVLKRQRLE